MEKFDKNVNIVIDNTQNPNEIIMINTKDFEKIEITYQETKEIWIVRVWKFILEKIKRNEEQSQEQEN